jgi:hypothetical protein
LARIIVTSPEEIHAAYEKYPRENPLVGDDTRIYGIKYSDVECMEVALCPPGLHAEVHSQFVEQSLDVTTLPGMYSADNYESVLSGEEIAISLLQQFDSRKKETLGHDGLWQTKWAHSLGSIKSADDLKTIAKNVQKAWKSAFFLCTLLTTLHLRGMN